MDKEKLRKKTGSRAIIGIGILNPVGVEVRPAVVPVKAWSLRELAIGLCKICLCPSMPLPLE